MIVYQGSFVKNFFKEWQIITLFLKGWIALGQA